MKRSSLVVLAALSIAAPARGEEAAASPPRPAPAPAGEAKPPPLTRRDVETLLVRADGNLALHAVSFDDEHLRRAVMDYGRAFAGLPADADGDLRFTASFGLAFAIARSPSSPNEASDAMKSALALDPESAPLCIVEGMLLEKAGRFPGAAERILEGLARLEKVASTLDPGRAWQLRLFALLSLGRAELEPAVRREHLALQRFLEAEKMADEALADPRTPRGSRLRIVVLTHVAAAYQHLDYLQAQVDVLDRLIRMDGGNSLHFYNRGLVAAGQNSLGEALQYYRQAVERDPRNPRPRLKIAYILLVHPRQGEAPDIRGARAEVEAYRALLGRENEEYCACRGEAARLEGNLAEAEKWFRRSLGFDPGCLKSLDRLVQILWRKVTLTPAEESELQEFKKRLGDRVKQRSKGSGTEAPKNGDETFC